VTLWVFIPMLVGDGHLDVIDDHHIERQLPRLELESKLIATHLRHG
jgi:hypothetical protein